MYFPIKICIFLPILFCNTANINQFTYLLSLCITYSLTPWLMEPGGSMPNSQGLSNNPYPEINPGGI